MLRKLLAKGILNSQLSTRARYKDPDTGREYVFSTVIHHDFERLNDYGLVRQTEISYRPTGDFLLVTNSLLELLEPDGSTFWQVTYVVEYNGSLTRVALKPRAGACK